MLTVVSLAAVVGVRYGEEALAEGDVERADLAVPVAPVLLQLVDRAPPAQRPVRPVLALVLVDVAQLLQLLDYLHRALLDVQRVVVDLLYRVG